MLSHWNSFGNQLEPKPKSSPGLLNAARTAYRSTDTTRSPPSELASRITTRAERVRLIGIASRRSWPSVLPSQKAQLHEGEREEQHEHHHGHGRSTSHPGMLECGLVDEQVDDLGAERTVRQDG